MSTPGSFDHIRHVEGLELLQQKERVTPPSGTTRCILRGQDGAGTPFELPLDDSLFSRHLLFLGNIGTGKTNAISQVIAQVKAQLTPDDLLIVFDTKYSPPIAESNT